MQWLCCMMSPAWHAPALVGQIVSVLTPALVPVQVCNLLHHFLLKAFPEQYEARAEETRGKSLPLNRDACLNPCFQLQLSSMLV